MATLFRLIQAADTQSEEGRKRLEMIGTTPIISKEYDPEYTILLVVGLIRQIKIGGWTMDASIALRHLVIWGSCVDKDVITELIGLAMDTSNDKWAAHVAELLRFMVLKRYNNVKWYANDTRTAFAIRSGLVELCLTFMERFGVLESFDNETDILYSHFSSIESILRNIYWIGFHQKTAKAIRSMRDSIEKELACLEKKDEITNNVNCKKLLEMARSMLVVNGSYCCRCNKSLSRTEVKLCNGCNTMAYCSRACQKEDWLDGHNVNCCKTYTSALAGQFQGRFQPMVIPEDERAAAKMKELEINMNMIQLKLFLDHSETIQQQASSLDIPFCDCVVVFDLRVCPFSVVVEKYTKEFNTPFLKKAFEDSKSKENITCSFISKIYDGSLIEGQTLTLKIQRLFPHEWLTNGRRSDGLVTTN